MSSLEEIIKAKGNERIANEISKQEAFERETEEIRNNIINNYCPRVSKALKVMRTIRSNDPLLWKKICPQNFDTLNAYKKDDYFFSDGWAHTLGFFGSLDSIGNVAGGACGSMNFVVTENDCRFATDGNLWSRGCAKRFFDSFEEFETRFRNFVNEQYGDNAYDLI